MMVIPVDVAIKRFYRCYVQVPEDASDGQVEQKVRDMIVEEQDSVLIEDPDLEIENHDIEITDIDWDGGWEDDDENEGR